MIYSDYIFLPETGPPFWWRPWHNRELIFIST